MFLFVIQYISYILTIGTFAFLFGGLYIDWRKAKHVEIFTEGSPQIIDCDGQIMHFSLRVVCTVLGAEAWVRPYVFHVPVECERCTRLDSLRSRSPARINTHIKIKS